MKVIITLQGDFSNFTSEETSVATPIAIAGAPWTKLISSSFKRIWSVLKFDHDASKYILIQMKTIVLYFDISDSSNLEDNNNDYPNNHQQ